MPRFTRRTLLASPALLAAQQPPARAQFASKRNLLSHLWPASKFSELAPLERFHPFPTASERPGWTGLPEDVRSALIAAGEARLKTPWEVLPATLFLEYARNGNRSRFEAVRNRRRNGLQELVVAECAE